MDEGFFLHESFGKTMFRPRNWDNSLCNNIIPYSAVNHKGVLDTLTIGTDVTNELHIKVMELVMLCWDVFDPDGIQKIILGCEFKIDTGSSKGVCYRSPSYGHYKGGIIMKHIKVLLNNGWITECKTGGYGAPNVLAPKPHQEKVDNIDDFVWRMCVSYRALNKITKPFKYPIGRCDDAVDDLGDGAGRIFLLL